MPLPIRQLSEKVPVMCDWRAWLPALGAVSGAACIGVAVWAAHQPGVRPPTPVARAAAGAASVTPLEPVEPSDKALPASEPTRLAVNAAGIDTPLFTTGLDANGSPVPPTGDNVDLAAWLDSSVTPGERGTSVIIGHVTTYRSGPSVFYNLSQLKEGQAINVGRRDGTTASFVVEKVESYGKDDFPAVTVYAQTDYPSLRLITCGNWDEASQHYDDNVVVFARLSNS